jgi:WD40 repeat protein
MPPPLCPKCGQALPADAPHGLCPVCLLQAGLVEVALSPPAAAETAALLPLAAFTNTPPATLPPGQAATGATAAAVSPPGYEILAELGRGGMGVVYKARQIQLNRVVALKMILAGGHASAADLARFRTEAEAIARLQHPHIVQIHEVAEHQGLPYFCLDFCDGGSLEKKLAGTPLPSRQAAALLEKLAQAMQAAHAKGVIHRDLKPANVLLATDGTEDTEKKRGRFSVSSVSSVAGLFPKITDFGLAKKLDEAGQTQSGAIMGTPSYMAPEQAAGLGKNVGPAADVYALGAILYECLTGRPPFRAATPLDTVLQVVTEDPVPPSRLLSKVPRDLETICLKCLQKEPTRRYASAALLSEDLARWQAGEPILARPVSRIERAVKWVKRRPAIAGLLAAIATVALVGFTLVLWQWQRAEQEYDKAENARRLAEENSAAADAALKKEAQQRRLTDAALKQEEKQRLLTASALKEEAKQRLLADQEKLRAEEQLVRAENMVYDNQITLAQRLYLDVGVDAAINMLEDCRLDLRHWEHAYLRRLCTGSEMTFKFHAGGAYSNVLGVAWSPNGKLLAVAAKPNELKVFDARTGKELLNMREHTNSILGVVFSPDSQRLASYAADRTARVWDVKTGKAIWVLGGHGSYLRAIAYSPDGTLIATASDDKTVKLWDAHTGREKLTLPGYAGGFTFNGVAFSTDSQRLVFSGPGVTRVWDIAAGKMIHTLQGGGFAVASSPGGKYLATSDSQVKLWNAATFAEVPLGQRYPGARALGFSPDDKHLAMATGGIIKIVEIPSGREVMTLRGHSSSLSVRALCFSPDGQYLLSASEDCTARVWDLQQRPECRNLKAGPARGYWRIAFSPDGKLLATTAGEVWDVASGKILKMLPGGSKVVAFSPDSSILATTASTFKQIPSGGTREVNGEVKLWDVRTWQLIATLKPHDSSVGTLMFSKDGQFLAAGMGDRYTPTDTPIKIWNVQTRQSVWPAAGAKMSMPAACNELLKGNGPWGPARWDDQNATQIFTDSGGAFICRSADGSRLVISGYDSARTKMGARVVDAQTGKELCMLRGQASHLENAVFSPDGRRIAATSDKKIFLFDAATGLQVIVLEGHEELLMHVVFSPDGRRLASASTAYTQPAELKLWEIPEEPAGPPMLREVGSHPPLPVDPRVGKVFFYQQSKGTGVFKAETGKAWIETTSNGDKLTFQETARTEDYVEILDAKRGICLRIHSTYINLRGQNNSWSRLYNGHWILPSEVPMTPKKDGAK